MIIPPLTPEAVTYAWRQLLVRAGAELETLPLTLCYGDEQSQSNEPGIIVQPCAPTVWSALLRRESKSLVWLPLDQLVPPGVTLPFETPVPVLFWGQAAEEGRKPLAAPYGENQVIFYADIVAATVFMLSRWEETIVPTRDEHVRFPGEASVAYQQGFLDRPLIDQYALILREWLKWLLPGWQPKTKSFLVKLTHDVDHIRRFLTSSKAIRTIGGDLLKRRNLRRAWQNCLEAAVPLVAPDRTADFRGIYTLAELSKRYGLASAFYFMATGPAPYESDYALTSPIVQRTIKDLRQQGFEIGLHPGYNTFNNLEQLALEKTRLDRILGETGYGGRQHYLRFQAPVTWRHWEQVGLCYDATVGYADQEGFRCGTCHPFRPFDLEQNRELMIWEYPLIVMEDTLAEYRQLTPAQGEARILELAGQCQAVEGMFVLLWHNSFLEGEWRRWGEMYRRLLPSLAEMQGAVSKAIAGVQEP